MNVGVTPFEVPPGSASLAHFQHSTVAVLRDHHTLLQYPSASLAVSPARQRELVAQWFTSCDVIVGRNDLGLLQLREELGLRRIPYVPFLMGCLPRGASCLGRVHRYLQPHDLLVVNCEAEIALARMFLPDASVRCVPFSYDDSVFYREDEPAQRAARAHLGIGPNEKLVLYSGRVTLEKNVHTVLKTFRIVLNAVPDATLVIVGESFSDPFLEFGVIPLSIGRALRRLMAVLGLDESHVRFAGGYGPQDLRALYSAADVLVNLTLHHDENFGLAQVEAMACGVPIVGTAWGGLKDTVVDGMTGIRVPAVVTAAGVKTDWWQAANAIVRLLTADEPLIRRLRAQCCATARERYSVARYGDVLNRVLDDAVAAVTSTPLIIRPSAFAKRFWMTCMGNAEGDKRLDFGRPHYRQGPDALRLYREMITPFAAATVEEPDLDAVEAWCLAAPLTIGGNDLIAVNDPQFPFEIPVPLPLADDVRTLIGRFTVQPVMPAECVTSPPATVAALIWMHEAGLVLPTVCGTIEMAHARGAVGGPTFEMHKVDARADVVWMA